MSRSKLVIAIVLLSLSLGIMVYAADKPAKQGKKQAPTAQKPAPPEKVVLGQGQQDLKKPPVPMSHKKHAEDLKIECKTCHHTGDESKKCFECHKYSLPCSDSGEESKQGDAAKPQPKQAPPAAEEKKAPCPREAFHDLCRDCHKDKRGPEHPDAPVKCSECHVKQEEAK